MWFKLKVLRTLEEINKGVKTMSKAVDDFRNEANANLSKMADALTNIAADEAKMAKEISDLSASGGDIATLADLSTRFSAMAQRTQDIANAVADSAPVVPPNA